MKVEKCLCCVPIEKAVVLCGVLLGLVAVSQVFRFNRIECATTIVAMAAFAAMKIQDSEKHRAYFFLSFSFWLGTAYFVALNELYEKRLSEDAITNGCLKMQLNGQFKTENLRSIRAKDSTQISSSLAPPIG